MQVRTLFIGLSLFLLPAAANAEIKSVKVPSANFRESPSTNSAIKFAADKFYPVEVISKKNGWAQIRDFEGDEAWVADRLLGTGETVVIKANRANVREKSNTQSDVIFKVERGEVFQVKKRDGRWLHVEDVNGEVGWIRDDLVWGYHPNGDDLDKDAVAEKSADKNDEKAEKAKEPPEDKKSADKKSAEPEKADASDSDEDDEASCTCPQKESKSSKKKTPGKK